MYKFLKIAFLGISLFTCFSAMASTMEDSDEYMCIFLCVDDEADSSLCRIYC